MRQAAWSPPARCPKTPTGFAKPGMGSLVAAWAQPLQQAGCLQTHTRVVRIEPDRMAPGSWQVCTQEADGAQHVVAGFDAVLIAQPATRPAPCWTPAAWAARCLGPWPRSAGPAGR